MTARTDRLYHSTTLRSMVLNFTAEAAGFEENEQWAQAALWHQRAEAIGVALGYMEQHVNLETGELTISLEPLDAAS